MATPEILLEAASYIQTVQSREGLLVDFPQEVAWQNRWINELNFKATWYDIRNTQYGYYLMKFAD